VPGDISIVGFDNIPFAALANPPLTTVGQPIRQLGERAAELLLHVIEDGTVPVETSHQPNVLLPNELIVRGSTAPPPAA
jgi:DNA-binding LacI/PurR family transcriptional regulator